MDFRDRRLAALFVAGVVLYYSPVLNVFNRPTLAFGIPLFPLYLFVSWSVLIVTAALLTRGTRA